MHEKTLDIFIESKTIETQSMQIAYYSIHVIAIYSLHIMNIIQKNRLKRLLGFLEREKIIYQILESYVNIVACQVQCLDTVGDRPCDCSDSGLCKEEI